MQKNFVKIAMKVSICSSVSYRGAWTRLKTSLDLSQYIVKEEIFLFKTALMLFVFAMVLIIHSHPVEGLWPPYALKFSW
jgi:hypothetical protein